MSDASSHPPVVMYSKPWCPYCIAAKTLLRRKGADFTVHEINLDAERAQEMRRRSGRHTVPQIFIGEQHVGGADELFALDKAGGLDSLLQGPSRA